ncbi:MAG: hypothetical protein QM650_02740 [Microlunatus sp.]
MSDLEEAADENLVWDHAAQLVESVRDQAGHQPGWDFAGIRSVLVGMEVDLEVAVSAGIAAARDSAAVTPGAIRWERYRPAITRRHGTGPKCDVCGRTKDACRAADAKAITGHHPFTPKPHFVPRSEA